MRFGKASVSLNLRNPFKASGGSTSVFVLYTNGQLTLNRGYLIDGGMAPEPVLAVLDDQIRMLYPSARGEKGYYITIQPPPEPTPVRDFAHALQQQLSSPAGSPAAAGPPTAILAHRKIFSRDLKSATAHAAAGVRSAPAQIVPLSGSWGTISQVLGRSPIRGAFSGSWRN
jgi:hypothetical protein